ncbi:MAG TPA: hypothetical protein GXX14_13695 [Clostridiaceae bacterium]|nr:hypothetical protein [Clostridiaceae bacterium]
MKELNGRERLLRSFNKQPVDRIPVSPFIYNNFVRNFYNDTGADIIQGTVDVYKYFGFDLMHRNINIRYDESVLDSSKWRVKVKERKEGDTTNITTVIRTPERELVQTVQYRKISRYQEVKAVTEWFIKDIDDFKQFLKYQPPVPALKFPELERAKKIIGDSGITAPWISGVFNYVADYRKLDDLLMDAVLEPELYKEMMEYFLQRIKAHIRYVLKEGVDVLSYAGNIASGTMVGPDFFRKNVMEYEKQLIGFIQSKGTHVLYHNCGDARNMIEVYNELGIHAFESITEPPYADNDLKDAVTRFDEHITLIGNLDQVTFLKEATPEEVKAKVKEKLEIVGGRKGFILGTTDFIDENTPYENLFAMVEAVVNR